MRFLFPGRSTRDLHRDYQESCLASQRRAVGWKLLNDAFHRQKLSVFIPRKDQCDVYISAQFGHISNEMYKKHLHKKKTAAQQEKEKDKTESNMETSVWTMDLQSVLTCPNTQASAMYYKTKLTVHNMTYYDLKFKQAFNYVFDETNGDLPSHMFGYLHYNHFRNFLNDNPDIKRLTIFSHGWGYQNKCTNVSNAPLKLAAEQDITIEQKILVSRHTHFCISTFTMKRMLFKLFICSQK